MELPKRKQIRCPYIDYSQTGVYFITFSTAERRNHFWMCPDRKYTSPDEIELNSIGFTVQETLQAISEHYPYASLDYYVIMPDHVHLLLRYLPPDEKDMAPRKDIMVLVSQIKGIVTKKIGKSVWQKSFFDHVIRNDDDYLESARYIQNNPIKWYYNKHSKVDFR